ncbi:MAG: NlpC/P60 family protein [Acidobacteria bacterium]|nr:MAG: NlpC/P60 family protein [Acidobacteriota bacterium]
MTQRTTGRHRQPARLSTTTLTRSAAVAATSTGLLAGTAATAGAAPTSPQEPVSGVPATDTLVEVVQYVAAAERPAVAAPAPEVDEAVSFGTSGFTAVDVVVETPAAEQAQEAVADRTSTAASRTETRTAPAEPAAPAPAPEPAAAPAPTGGILGIAAAYTGIYYVYGGNTPAGFDCSGYTQYVFAQAGISLPRTAAAQQASATPVSNPQPGDLIFYGYPAYHVGIYAGNGMMYDSGKPGIPSQLRAVFPGVSGYGRVG